MDKTSLGDRMKEYELVSRTHLTRRTPVIIRVDGKAFHTFTKRLTDTDISPYSASMQSTMQCTAQLMVHYIQNAVFAYTQSDEISILLVDWRKHETEQWYNAQVQKMVSISAAMATAYFGHFYRLDEEIDYAPHLPLFDSRVFTLPKEEVANYFIWRQQDATRNSINMLGQHFFSHKELHGKNVSQVQDMLMEKHGINWNDFPTTNRRGTCVISKSDFSSRGPQLDQEIPIFTKDREYIERWLDPETYLELEV